MPIGVEGVKGSKQNRVKQKQKQKQKRVAASSGTVSSFLGKGYLRPSNSAANGNGPCMMKGLGKIPLSNEDAEEFLYSMLGDECQLNIGVIKDVFCHCGYDLEKALDTLLELSASYDQFKNSECGSSGENNRHDRRIMVEQSGNCLVPSIIRKCQLTDKVSDSTCDLSEKELHEVLESARYDCRDNPKLLNACEEHSSSMSGMTKSDLQQRVLDSLFSIAQSSEHKPNSMDWKKVVKKIESFGKGLEFRSASVSEPHQDFGHAKEDAYQVCRIASKRHWDTMKSYYQKGKLYNRKAREADEKASREIFEVRNKSIQNTVTIDLHGQHVDQAIRLLKAHLTLFTCVPSIQFLNVITGCGAHGVGKGRLKQSVISLMEKEGIEWTEGNRGTVVIRFNGQKKFSFLNSDSDSE
ncbi:smr (Small MutS Related) domain-containing protein isoform X2 [Tasmannia lanceolata]|uniref:smr (Small MutS Related) domain-containing protein isoform X2 n=1 Tax=Tasmannia lanceolata TaxID=3420 RepID=UPI0040627C47